MKQRIGIEPNLTPVKEYLNDKGFHVESIDVKTESKIEEGRFDAFVITGQSVNFMGIHDTATKAPVIDASGLTPEQVYHELQLRLE